MWETVPPKLPMGVRFPATMKTSCGQKRWQGEDHHISSFFSLILPWHTSELRHGTQ
jgi:hypothetical protein